MFVDKFPLCACVCHWLVEMTVCLESAYNTFIVLLLYHHPLVKAVECRALPPRSNNAARLVFNNRQIRLRMVHEHVCRWSSLGSSRVCYLLNMSTIKQNKKPREIEICDFGVMFYGLDKQKCSWCPFLFHAYL